MGIDGVHIFRSEYGFCQSGVFVLYHRWDTMRAGRRIAGFTWYLRPDGEYIARRWRYKTAGTLSTGTVRMSVSVFSSKRDIAALVDAVGDIAGAHQSKTY